MISFGLGELGVVVLLALLFFDAKQVGKVVKWTREMRNKMLGVQRDWKSQIDKLIDEEDDKEELEKLEGTPVEMRKWGERKISAMPGSEKFLSSKNIVDKIVAWGPYQKTVRVGMYSPLPDELDTSFLQKQALADGKILLLPYIENETLAFAPIEEYGRDTETGPFGILEPLKKLRNPMEKPPELIFIPGRCFDETGGRIGRGKGYFDKYLQNKNVIKVGLCFDRQISQKKLKLESHDIYMDFIITEQRILEPGKTGDNG